MLDALKPFLRKHDLRLEFFEQISLPFEGASAEVLCRIEGMEKIFGRGASKAEAATNFAGKIAGKTIVVRSSLGEYRCKVPKDILRAA